MAGRTPKARAARKTAKAGVATKVAPRKPAPKSQPGRDEKPKLSPLYGVEDNVWFLGLHVFAKYVKVAFFRGASLRPVPPGPSKQKEVRYLDIYEDDEFDEAQFAAWVKQASKIPGERM